MINFWKSGRVVDCGALEKRWAEMFRRFESCLFRFTLINAIGMIWSENVSTVVL